MDIKAIMCDVDGTLLTSDGVVSPRTVEAIKKAKEKGILFGLSTGRDVNSVKMLLKEWGIDSLVDSIVGTGGAEIYDYVLNVDTQSYPLAGELIQEVIDHFQDMNVNFAIPWEGKLFAPKDDRHIQALSIGDKVPYEVVDFNEFLKEPKPKLIIVCDPEYMDPRISKTHGLMQVMDMHHIDMKNLCTFGDADNDYDMTMNAGVGVVMANGSEKTKSVADYITDDNNNDGIAKFIEEHIL